MSDYQPKGSVILITAEAIISSGCSVHYLSAPTGGR